MKQDTIESLKKQEEELEKLMMSAPVEGETKPKAATEDQPKAEEAPDHKVEAVTSPDGSASDDARGGESAREGGGPGSRPRAEGHPSPGPVLRPLPHGRRISVPGGAPERSPPPYARPRNRR